MVSCLLEYITNKYEIEPEHPFSQYPEISVFKNSFNKWFCVMMMVKRKVIDTKPEEEIVSIINVKCSPEIVRSLIQEGNFYPAYHMNKKHWITIPLDGTVNFEEICKLIDLSYELTLLKTRKR